MKVSWLRAALEGQQEICRDDRCLRLDVHPPHSRDLDRDDTPEARRKRGWVSDPCEPQRAGRVSVDLSGKRAWRGTNRIELREIKVPPARRSSTSGLDHAIAIAVSAFHIKIVSEIHDEVVNSYGSVTQRTVYRRLGRLTDRGCVVHVRFGPQLGGFLRARSRLLTDLPYLMECLADKVNDDR